MGDELAQVEALDRVLTRLALTEEDALPQVLEKLLPLVIAKLGATPGVQKKVMEILGHVNKRVKGHNSIPLPLDGLVALFVGPADGPPPAAMVANFALVYVEMAFERASAEARLAVVDSLLKGVHKRPAQQQALLMRLACRALAVMGGPRSMHTPPKDVSFSFLDAPQDRAVFLSFALKYLLHLPQSHILSVKPKGISLAAAMESEAEPSDGAAAPDAPAAAQVAPGMSVATTKEVSGGVEPEKGALVASKVGILNLTALKEVEPREVLAHYVVASCDPFEDVSRRGDELLRKRCQINTPKPAVDVENPLVLKALFNLFLGNAASKDIPADTKLRAPSTAVRIKLMGIFTKSIGAANTFPRTLAVIFSCMYGDDANVQLKSAGMEFLVWTFRHAQDAQLKPMAPVILSGLRKILAQPPSMEQSTMTMRGAAYQAIGLLSQRVASLFHADTDIAEQLFAALTTEPSGARAAVQEAVSMVASAYTSAGPAAKGRIEELLLSSMAGNEEAQRLCAIKWAVKLFDFDHVPARYICIMGSGDGKLEVKEEAKRGLKPKKDGFNPLDDDESADLPKYPALSKVLSYMEAKHPALTRSPDPTSGIALKHAAFLSLVRFAATCAEASWAKGAAAVGTEQEGVDVAMLDAADDPASLPLDYLRLLEHALVKESSSELMVEALQAMLVVAARDTQAFAAAYADRVAWWVDFLGHIDDGVRCTAAQLLGIVTKALAPDAASALLTQLVPESPAELPKGVKYETAEGKLQALGYVGATLASGTPAVESAELKAAATALLAGLGHKTAGLAAASALALGRIGMRRPWPLEDKQADEAATALSALVTGKDPKAAKDAVAAIGYAAAGARTLPSRVEALLKPVFALSTKSSTGEELLFAGGEAVAWATGGLPLSVDAVLQGPFKGLAAAARVYSGEAAAAGAPPPVDDSLAAEDGARAVADAVFAQVETCVGPKATAHSRAYGAVLLVSLVGLCGRHPRVRAQLTDIQEVMCTLLGDSNELTQELASRGLSLVYHLGDEGTQKQLVDNLVKVLSGGGTKRKVGSLTGDTKVFEEGQLGPAPGGGSISTYKELCSLANDLGQPDLVYRFMDLANHQATLTARRGAAFGVAGIAKLAGAELESHTAALVPRLFRYQFDPNKRIQDAMTAIWKALLPEPSKAVDAHFDAIVKDLLKEMGGRLWRSREAACLGVADILQGRRWDALAPHFAQLWLMTLRAIDDIKETVRVAAITAGKTLRSVTLRVADPKHNSGAGARAAVDAALPLLLEHGINSSVAEVRGIAVDSIAKIVKAAGPGQLSDHLPAIVGTMLESLSSLEDSRLNYIEQHAARLGLDSTRLEDARVSAARSSPLGDTLDLCARYTTAESLEKLVPRLTDLIKADVGLNTKVGTARFIVSLAEKLGGDMKAKMGHLIKALMNALRVNKSPVVRKAYAGAIAVMCKHATAKRVASVVDDAMALVGADDAADADAVAVAGLLAHEIARTASDAFKKHASAVLPTAFLCKHDPAKEVASIWTSVWEEGTTTASSAIRMFADDIAALITKWLSSTSWGRKAAAANAAQAGAKGNGEALGAHVQALMGALVAELPGRTWEGKTSVLKAVAALCVHCTKEVTALEGGRGADTAVRALLGAVERGNSDYRKAALGCLQDALAATEGQDFLGVVGQPLLDAANAAAAAAEAEKSEDGDDAGPAKKTLPAAGCLDAFVAAWEHGAEGSRAALSAAATAAIATHLRPTLPWPTLMSALAAARAVAEGAGKEGADARAAALLPRVLECSEYGKVAQVRTASLEALEAIFDMVKRADGTLPPESATAAETRLAAMQDGDRVPSVRSKAGALLLTVRGMAKGMEG